MKLSQLFLSYSASDKPLADQLRKSFEDLGVTIQDPAAMPKDADWSKWVRSGIEQSDGLIFIAPPSGSPGANNAFFEVGAASALGKPVMAVLPEDLPGSRRQIPNDVSHRHIVDGSRSAPDMIAASLIDGLQAA